MNLTKAFLITASFLAAALGGCGSTGSVEVDTEVPIPGGTITGKFRVGGDGTTSAELAGASVCLEICWSNGLGAEIGCVVVELPGATQVPPGAVRYSARLVDCPKDGGGGGGGMMAASACVRSGDEFGSDERQWHFLGGSIFPLEDELNLTYSISIQAATKNQAIARRDAVLAGGIGTPVGQGLQVLLWNEQVAEFDELGAPLGVRMKQAIQGDDFASFDFTLNGSLYAQLGDGGGLLNYAADNRWDVIELFVPISDFDISPRFDNDARTSWITDDSDEAWQASQRVSAD